MKQLFAGLLVAASLGAFAPRAHADTVAKADVDKFLAWFDSFTQVAVDNQNDCPKMATGLNKSIDDNAALLANAKKMMDSGAEMPADAQQHMMATVQKLTGAVAAKCAKDANVMAAFKRLPGRQPKQAPPAQPAPVK